MTTRKTYTREFKLDTLHLAETSGKPVTVLERELGLTHGLVYQWRQQLTRKDKQAFPGKGHLAEDAERLRQLERENTILRQERDILKKAISVFTQKP
jgi:transposase